MVPGPGIGEVPGNPGKIKTEVLSEKSHARPWVC